MLSKLFGSDVYEAYTAAYTWKSNQMAHAMMAFAGTTLLSAAACSLGRSALYGLAFIVIPVLKDTGDLVLDTARAKAMGRRVARAGGAPFRGRLSELVVDAFTDTFFWALGSVLAVLIALLAGNQFVPCTDLGRDALVGQAWTVALAWFVMFAFALAVPGRRFVREKRGFDRAGLPTISAYPTSPASSTARRGVWSRPSSTARAGLRIS